jgi:hypothetical protein
LRYIHDAIQNYAVNRIAALKPLPGYRLWLRFENGVEGTVDLAEHVGHGAFSQWSDPAAFDAVRLGGFGQPVWSDGVDLCPDTLYMKITGLTPHELFPRLAADVVHARA